MKIPNAAESITNQNVRPAVTASDLKRGEESFNFKLDK